MSVKNLLSAFGGLVCGMLLLVPAARADWPNVTGWPDSLAIDDSFILSCDQSSDGPHYGYIAWKWSYNENGQYFLISDQTGPLTPLGIRAVLENPRFVDPADSWGLRLYGEINSTVWIKVFFKGEGEEDFVEGPFGPIYIYQP